MKEQETFSKKDFEVWITADERGYKSPLLELWKYRDLALLLVRRDFVAGYKQTILGPVWAIIQPLISTLISALVFGGLAGLSPDGIPVFLFYMSGQVTWTYFSGCLETTSNTFVNNAPLMGKVYFPRFIMPVASTASKIISLLIQALLFTAFYIGYVIKGAPIGLDITAFLLPVYFIHLSLLGLGVGSILSAMTTKYRDTLFLITYGLTFWMYLSPIVYDVNLVPAKYMTLYMLNPTSPVITHIRYALFDQGYINWGYYAMSVVITLVLFFLGAKIFNKVERTFIDTV